MADDNFPASANNASDSYNNIKTLVFLDCEATGLKCSGKPRITEVSLLATDINHFIDLHHEIKAHLQEKLATSKHTSDIESVLPRVLNKLTMCVFPMKTIFPNVTQLTGLDNYNLEGQSQFDSSTSSTISTFLSRLQKPACLLAHNGNKFDFPLLQAELARISDGLFDDNLLCCDTYLAFKDLYSPSTIESENIKAELQAVQELLENGEFDNDLDLDSVKCYQEEVTVTKVFEESSLLSPRVERSSDTKHLLMTPPYSSRKRRRTSSGCSDSTGQTVAVTSCLDINPVHPKENEVTPERHQAGGVAPGRPSRAVGVRAQGSPATKKAKKRLAFEPGAGTPVSFSLINLHRHFLGFPPRVSHGAESDCLALMRVTAAIGPDFLTWVANNSQRFSDCQKMW